MSTDFSQDEVERVGNRFFSVLRVFDYRNWICRAGSLGIVDVFRTANKYELLLQVYRSRIITFNPILNYRLISVERLLLEKRERETETEMHSLLYVLPLLYI